MPDLPENYAADFSQVASQPVYPDCGPLPVTVHGRSFVTHSGLGLRRFRLIPATSFENLPPRTAKHFKRYAVYKFLTEPRVRPTESNVLLLHNHWANGYYHWLTEVLVKLMIVDVSRYAVLLPEDYPRFARESLDLFNCGTIIHVPTGHGVSVGQLTTVDNRACGRFSHEHVTWLRKTFSARCDATGVPSRRVYITRRGEPLRRVENENQVVDVLTGYGFETIDAAELSFCDQIRLFAQCEALVSVHGAGLTNCVFMPPGRRVLELYRELTPDAPVMNATYWHLCRAADLRYYYQFCRHGHNAGGDVDRINIIVDTKKLRRNVEMMLADLGDAALPRP